jgi:hypothetical protein
MSTTTAKGSGSTDNDGGVVLSGGTTTVLTRATLGQMESIEMKPVDNADADKALSAGTFAFDSTGTGIVAKKVTTTLSGVSKTFLQSGAAVPGARRQVAKIEGLTTSKVTTAIRNGKFNSVSGVFDGGFPQSSTDSFGTDDAVTSSELQYMHGNPIPASGSYGGNNTTSLV